MTVSLTPAAAERVQAFLAKRGGGVGLRLGVKKTGCSGFAYVVNYADDVAAGDHVFENRGVKVIVDAEMLQMMAEYLRPIEVNAETLALDAIAEVGPGGHFFGAQHTMSRYQTAFYQPFLSERRNFEAWQEAGSQDAQQRANRIWKELLETYQPPPLDPVIDEELQDYVARRKAGAVPE